MRPVGNVSLTVANFLNLLCCFCRRDSSGAASPYLAMACAGYTVLTTEVWLNAYGKSLKIYEPTEPLGILAIN